MNKIFKKTFRMEEEDKMMDFLNSTECLEIITISQAKNNDYSIFYLRR